MIRWEEVVIRKKKEKEAEILWKSKNINLVDVENTLFCDNRNNNNSNRSNNNNNLFHFVP